MNRTVWAYLRELGREFRMIWKEAREFDLAAWLAFKTFTMSDEYRDRLNQIDMRAYEMGKNLPEPYYVIHSHLAAYCSPVLTDQDADFGACLDDGERIVWTMIENRIELSGEGK
jgi:hypothetical protein